MGAIVARHERPLGPAAARNRGAQLASAPIIFFLDADVAVHADALSRGMARFVADPSLTALFGSYDDQPPARGLVSQFRNLLHHFVHQQGTFDGDVRPVHTFWTGCGMIRRQVFLDFGGFDPRLYPRPAIEDIELGYRLTRTGHRIVLARDVLATHMKRWSLSEMVRTDIFRRGVPWMLLIKRSGTVETDLNVKPTQQICVALTGLILLALVSLPWNSWAAVVAVLGSVAIVWLNRDFYRFLGRCRGLGFALAALPLHLLYYTCCGLSVLFALFQWHVVNRVTLEGLGRGRAPQACGPGRRAYSSTLPGSGRTEAGTLDNTIKVAVVRSDRRRGAVAEAFALIADDLRRSVQADSRPVVVPNLDNPARPWTCTHRDTLSAAADAILGAGASSITIAAGTGGGDSPLAISSTGWDTAANSGTDRPRFSIWIPTPGRGAGPWTTVQWIGPRGEPVSLRICSRVAAARCRVALGVARTHGLYRVGLGLTDLTGVYHPDDGYLPGQERGAGSGPRGCPPGPRPWWNHGAAGCSGPGWG